MIRRITFRRTFRLRLVKKIDSTVQKLFILKSEIELCLYFTTIFLLEYGLLRDETYISYFHGSKNIILEISNFEDFNYIDSYEIP